jgi:hypothetical protein
VGDEGEIDFNAFLHRWISEALGNPVAIGCILDDQVFCS